MSLVSTPTPSARSYQFLVAPSQCDTLRSHGILLYEQAKLDDQLYVRAVFPGEWRVMRDPQFPGCHIVVDTTDDQQAWIYTDVAGREHLHPPLPSQTALRSVTS